jgi:hypothetical protein
MHKLRSRVLISGQCGHSGSKKQETKGHALCSLLDSPDLPPALAGSRAEQQIKVNVVVWAACQYWVVTQKTSATHIPRKARDGESKTTGAVEQKFDLAT